MDWEDEVGPEFLTAVPWLERDPSALTKLMDSKQPRKILMVVGYQATVWYILGYATQYGFGTDLFNKRNFMF